MLDSKKFNYDISREIFLNLILSASELWEERQQILYNKIKSSPLLLYGFGSKGQRLAQQIRSDVKRDLVVYDRSEQKREFARELGFQVINCGPGKTWGTYAVILGACQHQVEQADEVGENSIFFQEASYIFDPGVREFRRHILGNLDLYFETFREFDQRSKAALLAVLKFRVNQNPRELSASRAPQREMYLDMPSLHRSRKYEVVLDVGAYDGDTLASFLDRFYPLRGIAVEANSDLFPCIERIGKGYDKGVKILPFAAWSCTTQLVMSAIGNGMASVSADSKGQLRGRRIDEYISERVDFVKMDIEGAEYEAILGSEQLLKTQKPDLAIAAYHKPDDIPSLHALIKQIGYSSLTFSLDFAHYSDCIDDSIIYVFKK